MKASTDFRTEHTVGKVKDETSKWRPGPSGKDNSPEMGVELSNAKSGDRRIFSSRFFVLNR